jgi:chromate transporter
MGDLGQLLLLYAQLSLLAIGGGNTVLPEMQRQVVAHGWLTASEFAALFAIAQAAPGPNLLVSTLVGWHVGGLAGALTATFGIVGPSSTLTLAVTRVWDRFRDNPWRRRIQAGLTPLTVGLVMAAAVVLCETTSRSVGHVLVTLVAAGVLLVTRLNPLWLLGAGAALGAAGLL